MGSGTEEIRRERERERSGEVSALLLEESLSLFLSDNDQFHGQMHFILEGV